MSLVLAASLLSLSPVVSSAQSFSSQPGDVTVEVGASLTLPCKVVGRLVWSEDHKLAILIDSACNMMLLIIHSTVLTNKVLKPLVARAHSQEERIPHLHVKV